jgi:hypothetical protein
MVLNVIQHHTGINFSVTCDKGIMRYQIKHSATGGAYPVSRMGQMRLYTQRTSNKTWAQKIIWKIKVQILATEVY